ncbi:kinase-like protein [Lojkania enalia]|uniref:Kinase-like protein n=1 Tax=Lojkania enalia TaxID=147567 RepID=A0A9P4N6V6_9PLEO|nr:kinase-like protein [Didymosphaeria enalia]
MTHLLFNLNLLMPTSSRLPSPQAMRIAANGGRRQRVEHGAWSAVPRLYIVLRRIGLLKLRDLFFSRQFSDAHFPYTNFSLPSGMAPKDKSAFLQAQRCVMTSPNHISKWDLGEHAHFASKDQVPLEVKAILGTGGYSQVEAVICREPGARDNASLRRQLVRKIMRRGAFGRAQHGLEIFKSELHILKRVQHKHLVEIVGSYSDPVFVAMIMSPVADCDLAVYLTLAPNDPLKMSSMRTFFGCLATALAYLHGKKIRHKDIKPSNILVHGTNVLITDFGLAKEYVGSRSTTEGPTARTEKYCAPEVARYTARNSSSDIWSLGCVFMEMLTVLKRVALAELAAFFREHGTSTTIYHANSPAIELWLSRLRNTKTEESSNGVVGWIEEMLAEDRDLRPSAEALVSEIIAFRSVSDRVGEFCGICCRAEDETFDIEMDDEPLFVPKIEEPHVITSIEQTLDSLYRSPPIDLLDDSIPITPESIITQDILPPTPFRSFRSQGSSRQFCGLARMTSPVDFSYTLPHWQEDKWTGNFSVEWKCFREIGYDDVKHLTHNGAETGRPITMLMHSGMEICFASGIEMMRRFEVSI